MASRRETRCTDYSASPKSQSSCECCRLFRCPHFLYMQESLCQSNAACSEEGAREARRAVSLRQNNLGSLIAQKRKEVFTFFSLALIIHCKTEICCSRELVCCRRTEPTTGGRLAIHPGTLYSHLHSTQAFQRHQQLPASSGTRLQRMQLFQPKCSGC